MLTTDRPPSHSKVIGPVFEKLEAQYPNIGFFKCDVDDQEVRPGLRILFRLQTAGNRSADSVSASWILSKSLLRLASRPCPHSCSSSRERRLDRSLAPTRTS